MEAIFENWKNLTPAEQQEILTTRPGAQPPDGIVPNFVNPPTRNDIAITVITIFLLLVVVTGSLRLYARAFVLRTLKLEDYLGFIAYIPYFGLTAVFIRIIGTIGFMVDLWNIPLGVGLQWSMYVWIYRLIYAVILLFVKTAILIEWKNLFLPNKTRNWFYWGLIVMLVVNNVAYTVAIITTCLRCRPIRKIWQPWADGTCSNQKYTDVATTFVNLALDVAILLLPQPIIWRLNMTRQRRIGVSLIFSVGLFVVTCAIGRIHSNLALDYYGNTTRGGSENIIWGYGEATFVMVVFAAPGIPKAFTNQSPLAGFISTFRSWTRLGGTTRDRSNGSDRANAYPWVRTIGGSGGGERKPSDTELDLMETRNDLEGGFKHAHVVEPNAPTTENEIWKTTTFETREHSASKTTTEQVVGRQHPWMDVRRR